MLKSMMIAALVLAIGAMTGVISQAQADTVWVFPNKGSVPGFAERHDHAKKVQTPRVGKRFTPAHYALMVKTGRWPG